MSNVPVIATISSVSVTVYVVANESTAVRTFDGSNDRLPSPLVLSTVPFSGVVVGQLKFPICNVEDEDIESVTIVPHDILPDIFYSNIGNAIYKMQHFKHFLQKIVL